MKRGGHYLSWIGAILPVLLLASCSSGDDSGLDQSDTSYRQSDSRISGFGVVLDVPAGWSSRNNGDHGLQIALNVEDLGTHQTPSGPRLTVTPGNTLSPEPTAVIDALAEPAVTGTELIEEPETVFVGGTEGVSVGLAQSDDDGTVVVRRFVVVNTGGTDVLQFLMEAPEEQWAAAVATMEPILGNVAYEPGDSKGGPTSTLLTPATTDAEDLSTTVGVTTTTATESAIRGTGSADDPYQLPYYETYSAPVDDRWIERAAAGEVEEWTWDVVGEQLIATAHNVELFLPRAPWTPEFELPRAGAIEIHIDATQPTTGTSCGLALYFRDTPYDGGIGLLVDSSEQRVLLWAPISGQKPEEGQWVADSRIRQGATNQIGMSINSLASTETDELSVFVNGQVVTTLAAGWSETLGAPFGFSPLAMVEPGDAGGECRFDNFTVTQSTP